MSALEIVPRVALPVHGGRLVTVPFRVVYHYDPEVALYYHRKAAAAGRDVPLPKPPHAKFADQPGGIDFWHLRVESADEQVTRSPPESENVTKNRRPARLRYKVVELSPSKPYERELDLDRLFDFSKPGEYRVQIVYDSDVKPDPKMGAWDGSFTSPVFTVEIRE